MLKHDPTPDASHTLPRADTARAAPPGDALQERVTAHEFAAAVAALEARRAADAQKAQEQRDTTVPLGQAVDELGIHIPPAEIWAEVQAQRAQPRPVPPAQAAARKIAALLVKLHAEAAPRLAQTIADWQAQVAAAQSTGTLGTGTQQMGSTQSRRPRKPVFYVAIGVLFAALLPTVFNHHHGGGASPPPASSETRTLAEVRDNEPVSVTEDTLEKLQHGQDLAQTLVQAQSDDSNGWTLVKHDGHMYVRGYTLPLSDNALQVGQVKLYNDNDAGVLSGEHDQSVTLRLDTLQVDKTNSGDDWREMDVSHIHSDAHTHEDW